ncbi:hypothetical protein [Jannaschia seohaensis]|uniref:Chemotaxis protein CheA n=1 Tax=Jannaschia seohaensis TaxID=475081 RepID=A0A2Y9AXF0_9RHOB|nr:hypothetical protein [Jannaschia seohaensis]PWJ18204.1 hypothetical protein BCF38_105192 [Jannaschia seohaensis]SSA46729.1 hypothetical protein SAMN05421539_105192 [Jannaschia seohaensis]
MVPANKILTVTYGTFSCTLEGFDDPFSAMTEIAEYFRDLAAKDRYFGAEPPTPDMERLEQITAAAMTSPVKAENAGGRLVLRPEAAAAPAYASAPDGPTGAASEPAETAAFVPTEATEEGFETDTAAEAAPEAEAEPADMEPPVDESQPVEEEPVEEADQPEALTEELADQADTDLVAEEADEAANLPEAAEPSEAETPDETAEWDEPEDVTPPAEAKATEDMVSVEVQSEEPYEGETVAARLARMRDADDSARFDCFEFEDAPEDAPDVVAEPETVDATDETEDGEDSDEIAAEAELTTAEDESEEVEPAAAEAADREDASNAIDQIGAAVSAESAETDATPDAEPAEKGEAEVTDLATAAEAEQQEIAAVQADDQIDPLVLSAAQALAPAEDDAPEAETAILDDDPSLTADLAALFSPRDDAEEVEPEEDAAEQPEAHVTVRKVRRRDRLSRRPDVAEPAMSDAVSLEDDEEADLMAELAAIEAELARDATGADLSDDEDDLPAVEDDADEDDDLMSELADIERAAAAEAETSPEAAESEDDANLIDEDDLEDARIAAALLEDDATSEEAVADEDAAGSTEEIEDAEEIEEARTAAHEPSDLERLFAATDSRLSGEDASRRHANISHLKAAVAARRADDTIEPTKTDNSNAYREDLANTVRPRRPAAEAGDAADAGKAERGSPLVLISEQRVETAEAPKPEKDIAEGLPRGMPAPASGEDFEQFAEEVGAVDLADVLEAAAVFSGTVMGQETFSRPRLLHLAAEAVDDLSREDGLRGFGQLLRDGTIRKVGRGTFTLGTESRFQARARRRAG